MRPGIAILLVSLVCQQTQWAGEKHTVRARWEELNAMIAGERVTVEGTFRAVRGRVVTVDSSAIDMDTGRRLEKHMVQRIRGVRHTGNGRTFGRRIGGAAGLALGLAGAAAIGLTQEWRSTSNQKAVTLALAVAGLPDGLIIGHMIGKKIDQNVLWIELTTQATSHPASGSH